MMHLFWVMGFERGLNAYFVALITKKEGAEDIKDFRRTNLLRGAYKLLAKVLASGVN